MEGSSYESEASHLRLLPSKDDRHESTTKSHLEAAGASTQSGSDNNADRSQNAIAAPAEASKSAQPPEPQRVGDGFIYLRRGQALDCGFHLSKLPQDISYLKLSYKDVRRWTMAAEYIKLQQKQSSKGTGSETDELAFTECPGLSLVASNLPYEGFSGRPVDLIFDSMFGESIQESSMFFNIWILSLIYGGVHLTAWDYPFPSSAERTLWKLSGFGMMGVLPILLVFWLPIFTEEWGRKSKKFMEFATLSCGLALLAFYLFCRAYLVVESFISLRQVPLGVYSTVPWVQSIPHI